MTYDINPWAQKEKRKHQAVAHTQLMDKLYSPEIDTCSVNTKTYSGVFSYHPVPFQELPYYPLSPDTFSFL